MQFAVIEIDIHLKICGPNSGDEASIPPYLRQLTAKQVSESIKDQIITSQVRNTDYYNGHRVPLPATLLKIIKKINYISEDPDLTHYTAQKGITILLVTLLHEGKYHLSTSFMNTFQAHYSHRQKILRNFPSSPII